MVVPEAVFHYLLVPREASDMDKSRFAQFAKRTTFHGFREIYHSSSWWQKITWVFVIAGCTAMLGIFVYIQTNQYLHGPPATRVGRLGTGASVPNPTIWLALSDWSWIDATKAESLGITPEEIQVAMGYIEMGILYNSTVPVEEAKKRLQEKMEMLNLRGILQMFHAISFDSFDGSTSPKDVTAEKLLYNSTCVYILNTTSAKSEPFVEASIFNAFFNFTTFWNKTKELEQRIPGFMTRRKKPLLLNKDNFVAVGLEPGYQLVSIGTETTVYKKLSHCTEEHPLDELYYVNACRRECELKTNASFDTSSCIPYVEDSSLEFTESFREGVLPLCHHGVINATTGETEGKETPVYRELTPIEVEQRGKALTICQSRCLPRCDQSSTTWSVSTSYAGYMADSSTMQITFQAPENVVVIEEVQQYQWHDLISDFGGLLGLWLGASMMSLFQLLHLCLCPSRAKKTVGTQSAIRMPV